jgi:tetratricopeptide (TPR) repeat protein
MRSELAYAYATAGRKPEAQKILSGLSELSTRTYIPSYYFAVIYAALGQNDQAIEWLERAHDERSNFLASLRVDPAVDVLRSDPRFGSLVERVGLR